MKVFMFLGIALVISACSSTPKYSHHSADQNQFLADRYACMLEVGQGNCEAFSNCMAVRGYSESSDGTLEVPKNMAYACSKKSAGAAFLQGFGKSYNANRPVRCNSIQTGNSTQTNCQ